MVLTAWQLALEFTTGKLGAPDFITASMYWLGTIPQLQLLPSSQTVLTAPVQLLVNFKVMGVLMIVLGPFVCTQRYW